MAMATDPESINYSTDMTVHGPAAKRKRNLCIYNLPATVDADITLVFLFSTKESNRVRAMNE